MRPVRRSVALLLFALLTTAAVAQAPHRFDDPGDQERFRELVQEIRCLVCQGQSIGDSNAGLARDMRAKVHELILAGESNAQVREYMTQRYGDFVLFRPPVKPATWALWFSPLLLAGVAVTTVLILVHRRRRAAPPRPLTPEEQRRAQPLLGDDDEGGA